MMHYFEIGLVRFFFGWHVRILVEVHHKAITTDCRRGIALPRPRLIRPYRSHTIQIATDHLGQRDLGHAAARRMGELVPLLEIDHEIDGDTGLAWPAGNEAGRCHSRESRASLFTSRPLGY